MTSRTTTAAAIVGSLALSLGLSTLVLPQSASAQSYQMPRAPVGTSARVPAGEQSWRFESEEMRRRNMTPEEVAEAEAEYGPERMELARRVAELVEQGHCREARELANQHGERQMALRVRRTCRAR